MSDNKPISLQQVAEVIAYVESLDFEAKLKRVDRIFADQPAVLGAVVQLHSLGVDYPVQEHAMHVLLILYECFTRYVSDLPRISKEMVQAAFDNNVAELRFYDGETTEEAARLQRLAALEYPERNVLAFVVGYLDEQLPTTDSREKELVINACKAVMNVFVSAKQLARGQSQEVRVGGRASGSRRKPQSQRRQKKRRG
jgi:hypothetical protein